MLYCHYGYPNKIGKYGKILHGGGRKMDQFKLVSEYAPTGDQPEAIKELVAGFKEGNQFQTLLPR